MLDRLLPLLLAFDANPAFDSIAFAPTMVPRASMAIGAHVRPGPLDTLRLREELSSAIDSLVAEGHLLATASADSLVADSGASILYLDGSTGPRFSWSDLVQDGSRLGANATRRLAHWRGGEQADPADLDRAVRRLEATGWVSSTAEPRMVREPRSLRLRGALSLEDLPSSMFEAVGGWSTGKDATGQLHAQLANLLGTARSLEFGIEKDGNGSRARAQWTEPWLGPLDVALRAGGELQGDSLVHGTRVWADLEGSPGSGNLTLSLGLGWWSHAERAPGDTVFAEAIQETSTRIGLGLAFGDPDPFWPTRRLESRTATEIVRTDGRSDRVRSTLSATATWPISRSLGAQARLGSRGVWPLDSATGLAEWSSPGGIDGWHGWREGTPWTPSWAWGAVEARLGSSGRGGLRIFWEPGLWWVQRPDDRQWEARATWTTGGGIRWRAGAWEIEALLAGERNTPSWEDALVHLRARNRF